MNRQWIVAQIGAREHYAVPRLLQRRSQLSRLYTDAWCRMGHSFLRRMPEPLCSFANRFHEGIPSRKVRSYTRRAIYHRLRYHLSRPNSGVARFQHYMDVGADFASRVRDDLRDRIDDWHHRAFFGYDTGSLEVLEYLAGTSCVTVVDQMDPGRVHREIMIQESEDWPGWAKHEPRIYEPYEKRRETEWNLSSLVVVNSEWSKKALMEQGVPAKKISVISLAYEPPSVSPSFRSSEDASLNVLWLGSVNLTKGIQYLMQAARLLQEESIRFDVVGPLEITDEAVQSSPGDMCFWGGVPRDQTSKFYQDADVFVLPTLSDGFAITQLEAMAHGCPVITTPNCGRVVTPEEDGLLVPSRDAEALAKALLRCAQDREMIATMSRKAQRTAQRFTLDAYADRLLSVVEDQISA